VQKIYSIGCDAMSIEPIFCVGDKRVAGVGVSDIFQILN